MKKIFFIFLLIFLISGLNLLFAINETFIVVIDAGHGGKDVGAIRGTYKEKDINLGVALTLGKLIESNMKDVKVVYTRKSDVFIDLYKRSEIANKAKANLFISIHTNSTASKVTTASGADTYILGLARSDENLAVAKRENSVILLEDNYSKRYEGFDPNSPESNILFEFMTNKYMDQSLEFASNVQNGITTTANRVDRGVAQAGFLVLRESGMPSVLIELGFINNPTEAKFLTSSIGQRNMANAIYNGFEKYKRNFDKKQGKNIPTTRFSTEKEINPPKEVVKKTDDDEVIVNLQQPEKIISVPSEGNASVKQSVSNKKVISVEAKTNKSQSKGVSAYKIQFLTSSEKLSTNSSSFKGLSPIDVYVDGNLYKYTYGATTSEIEAQKLQRQVRAHFKDAFIIKFVDGVRIK